MSGLPCNERMDCTQCPKAVENSIHYTHNKKGFHLPPHKCETNILFFLLKGQILINSEEYAGTIINSGEFVLQAIASKVEILAMTDSEGILYTFDDPKAFCYDRYTYILKNVPPPLISEPLKIKPEIKLFLEGVASYLNADKICKELLEFKRKELYYLLAHYYTDYELSPIVHSLSQYTSSFEYFILKHHKQIKSVEDFAQLGGYSVTTFRRIFKAIFNEPAYEWMMKQRKESILYQLRYTDASISEICFGHGFESLSHFSNFCKKFFGDSPRNIRKKEKEEIVKKCDWIKLKNKELKEIIELGVLEQDTVMEMYRTVLEQSEREHNKWHQEVEKRRKEEEITIKRLKNTVQALRRIICL